MSEKVYKLDALKHREVRDKFKEIFDKACDRIEEWIDDMLTQGYFGVVASVGYRLTSMLNFGISAREYDYCSVSIASRLFDLGYKIKQELMNYGYEDESLYRVIDDWIVANIHMLKVRYDEAKEFRDERAKKIMEEMIEKWKEFLPSTKKGLEKQDVPPELGYILNQKM